MKSKEWLAIIQLKVKQKSLVTFNTISSVSDKVLPHLKSPLLRRGRLGHGLRECSVKSDVSSPSRYSFWCSVLQYESSLWIKLSAGIDFSHLKKLGRLTDFLSSFV